MSIRRIAFLTLLAIYTSFAVITFWLAKEYTWSGLYFIALAVGFFKILKYTKKDEERRIYKTDRD